MPLDPISGKPQSSERLDIVNKFGHVVDVNGFRRSFATREIAEQKIAGEVAKGFTLGDRVLRPARVVISGGAS